MVEPPPVVVLLELELDELELLELELDELELLELELDELELLDADDPVEPAVVEVGMQTPLG